MSNKVDLSLVRFSKSLKFLIFATIFSLHGLRVAHGEIDYQEMKGVHDLLRPEFDYLSPIYGFTLLGSKTLKHMRFYGNYGPKKKDFGCLENATHIHQLLIANQDCPQDYTSELIQRLFPSQDGVNFVANQVDSDPVSHLSSEILGKILMRISKIQDLDFVDKDRIKNAFEDIKNILSLSLNPLSHFERLQVQLKKEQRERGRTEEEKQAIERKIVAAKAEIKNIISSNLEAGKHSGRMSRGKEKDFEGIAHLIIEALKESRVPGHPYPKYLPEQTLLAYFWKRGNDKEDFIQLFKGMPDVMKDPSFLLDPKKRAQFVHMKYSRADYDPSYLIEDPKVIAGHLLESPEKLVFYVQQNEREWQPIPHLLTYGQTVHLGTIKYSDCGETSLRNFLNIVLYNSTLGIFDVHFLKSIDAGLKADNPGFEVYPNLISFYEKHFDPAAAGSQKVRDEWSEKVTSGHDGVAYNLPRDTPLCNISSSKGGIDNMLVILDRLLFYPIDGGGTKKTSPLSHATDHSGKLDALCKFVSREGFNLSWSYPDQMLSNINEVVYGSIEFSINESPSFTWIFKSGHFIVEEIAKSQKSWKDKIAREVSKELARRDLQHSHLLLQWFVNESNWDMLTSHLRNEILSSAVAPPSIGATLIYAAPLSTEEGRLNSLEKIIRSQRSYLYPMAKNLQRKLFTGNVSARSSIFGLMADNDYPLGDPEHTVAGVVYNRVTGRSDLAALGRMWRNSKDLNQPIWGDTVKLKDGSTRTMKYEDAQTYCASIGARLPTRAEFQKLVVDFGYPKHPYYQPDFLPNLTQRKFWTSTTSEINPDSIFVFDGNKGSQSLQRVTDDNISVRCVAH